MTGGGIAQLARVLGSYPIGRWFESCCRYHSWPVGQEVKTPPFHGGIMGSIPVRVTKNGTLCDVPNHFGDLAQLVRAFASHARGHGFESPSLHHFKKACNRCGCRLFLYFQGFADILPGKAALHPMDHTNGI